MNLEPAAPAAADVQLPAVHSHALAHAALIGAVTGMTLGLALAAAVTSAFSDEGLTFAVPAGALIAFTVVAIVAGVLAAVLPARRAARTNVLAALAYE
jgi:putative ABC transport system permease protein